MEQERKQKILIADDSEINRSILTDMLGDEYEIIEAEDGVQTVTALRKYGTDISLVLLDIVMPEMDGFGVLATMNKYHWIEDIPVIMISSETASTHIERAFEMGVTDFISRPFDSLIVHRRVVNTILLYTKQKNLINLVADQIYEKEQRSSLMIDILSHIVEFRNGESGLHVVHVRILTGLLLKHLLQKTNKYQLSQADISPICMASALHDIGKISIDARVLNKPGKLTDEEFAIMKTHSLIGAKMLEELPYHKDESLIRFAYEICRWHHERYDGRGYPDGLKGDDIPISAQIVAMADVYDALTSERVYKPAFSHDTAIQMILDGQCGAFNPLLLECLTELADGMREELDNTSLAQASQKEMRNIVQEMQQHEELTASERTLRLLEHERMKFSFFSSLTEDIQFEYTLQPPMVTLSSQGAKQLGLEEIVMDPLDSKNANPLLDQQIMRNLSDIVRSTTPGNPTVQYDCKLQLNGEERWCRIIARAMWSSDEPPRYTGTIGKAVDIHDSQMKLVALERQASHDSLTGLLNHAYAKQQITGRLKERPAGNFALAILDLDYFKQANDTYGHMFGDEVLKYMAERLRSCTRGGDIAARVGGDEFVVFLEYKSDLDPAIHRIHSCLTGGDYENFKISVSMGVSTTEMLGADYETLFHAADQALYAMKRGGRGHYLFYNPSMQDTLTMVSPIDSDQHSDGSNTEGGESQ